MKNIEEKQLAEQQSMDRWLAINTVATVGSFILSIVLAIIIWQK